MYGMEIITIMYWLGSPYIGLHDPILDNVTLYQKPYITPYWQESPCIGMHHPILEKVTLYGMQIISTLYWLGSPYIG